MKFFKRTNKFSLPDAFVMATKLFVCVAAVITSGTSAWAQAPSTGDLPGFRIESDAVSGEPGIAHGAEEWRVVLPKKLSIALLKAAPGFKILDPALFAEIAKRDRKADAAVISAAPNALIADFNGDRKSDLIVIGTVDNALTAMTALSNRGGGSFSPCG